MSGLRIFLSYRRDDSSHQVGRLFDHLERGFGRGNVFKDVDSIPAGSDFRQVLVAAVADCDVAIVVIGDQWLSISDKKGLRRLDDPGDFVRIEVEAALARGMLVVPVLVGSASMPPDAQLPECLRPLAYRNAVKVRPDPDFRVDIQRLVAGVKSGGELTPRMFRIVRQRLLRAKRLAAISATVATLAIVAAVVMGWRLYHADKIHPDLAGDARTAEDLEAVPLEITEIGPNQVLEVAYDLSVPVTKTRKENHQVLVDGKYINMTRDTTYVENTKQARSLGLAGPATVKLYKSAKIRLPYLLLVMGGRSTINTIECDSQPILRLRTVSKEEIENIRFPKKTPLDPGNG